MTETWRERAQRSDQRLGAFLRLRREQLGLTVAELEAKIARKRCKGFERIESGEKWVHHKVYPFIEQALELPPGFLLQISVHEQPFGKDTALEWIQILGAGGNVTETSTTASVSTCPRCRSSVSSFLLRYDLKFSQRAVRDDSCICNGTPHSEANVLLRFALAIARVKSILVLGGSPDVDEAFEQVRDIKVYVVRDNHHGGLAPQRISEVDVIALARGQVGHSTTAPYLKALRTLPKAQQPVFLAPRSSNVIALAEEIIWNRDAILSSVVARDASG